MKPISIGRPGSEKGRLTRAVGVVGTATLFSRIMGYVRDMVLASFFGAGLTADAFIAAFRIPNLLRRLFGEGSLSIAFVPVFTQTMLTGGRRDGLRLAVCSLKLLLICLAVVTIVGVVAAPLIIRLVAPGFAEFPDKLALTILLTRIMFPYVILIGLVALCMGILNALGHFAAPAVAPVLLNLAMIASVVLVSRFSSDETVQAIGLAAGVILGGVLQLWLQLPFLVRHGVRFWETSGLWHPRMRTVGMLMLPTIFGAAVYQINILVGTLLASLLPQGSVSYLYYADRLVQFPLGIFAQAAATAVLPSLSRQVAGGDGVGVADTFGYAMNLVLFITIPAMVGLIVLREPMVALLFRHGAFDAQSAQLTSDALLYYAGGLWAFAAVRIVVSMFYALQDTRTPVVSAAVAVVANIVLGMALMGPMKHCGLALATSMASALNLAMLVVALRRRLGSIRWRPMISSCLKTVLASAVMALAVTAICKVGLPTDAASGRAWLLVSTGAGVIGGGVVFFVTAWLLNIPEWARVVDMATKRWHRS
jgi:putative peptidoglycan lipid II flippase